MKGIILTAIIIIASLLSPAQVVYPYPLMKKGISIENSRYQMAYMDIAPAANSKEKTILLLHGKNFNGYYWKDIIPALSQKGFRVIVPDQLGWGRSDKPDLHYSFHMLASASKTLLDSLGVKKIILLGHSMGGMLATRFALLFPDMVEKMILENPIGLEDYRLFVPYQPIEKLYAKEKAATYESYKKYQQSYYPEWKPEYEQFVQAQAESLKDPGFDSIAWVNAVTYQMIYEQPVIYELEHIRVPCLFIIGQMDRTVVGKDQLTETQKRVYGQYPDLGRKIKDKVKNSKLAELPGIGHIPHVQDKDQFLKILFDFL